MWMYNLSHSRETNYGIHDDANLLLLRKDLHVLFDAKYWAFVPREGRAVVTFLRCSKYAMPFYHGRAAHPLQANAAYVFARFAWSIFGLSLSIPTQCGIAIQIWDVSTNEWKSRSEQEQPAQLQKRGATTLGVPSTPNVPNAAQQAHPATPSATSLPDKGSVEDLYRHTGGQGGLLWDSPYALETVKVKAKKRRRARRADYGLGSSVRDEVDGSDDGCVGGGDNDAEVGGIERE